jgi:predicted kinase
MTYLFLMLGFPGSGKSYVAEWLAPKMHAVHVRSDDLRLKMFGQNRLALHKERRYLLPVIGAMEYIAHQTLAASHSLVHDANFNKRNVRQSYSRLAEQHQALAITVWVQAPIAIAKQRVIDRTAAGGHEHFEEDLVERMAKRIQAPSEQERVIILDGTASSQQQQVDFEQQLARITSDTVQ